MVDERTRTIVEAALRAALGRYGYDHAEIDARRDQDGEHALFVTARFQVPGTIPASRDTTAAMSALRGALLDTGDDRFPYLDYVFPEEPSADEAA